MDFRFTGEQLAPFIPDRGFDLVGYGGDHGADGPLHLIAHFKTEADAIAAMTAAIADGRTCFVSGARPAMQLDFFGAATAQPTTPALYRRTYAIRSWRSWDADVDAGARDFKRHFGVFPNVLLASSSTLARIDMVARRGKLINDAGERPLDGDPVTVASFLGDGYDVFFALDEKVQGHSFSLIFDSDPDGGEPAPDDDTAVARSVHAPQRRAG